MTTIVKIVNSGTVEAAFKYEDMIDIFLSADSKGGNQVNVVIKNSEKGTTLTLMCAGMKQKDLDLFWRAMDKAESDYNTHLVTLAMASGDANPHKRRRTEETTQRAT